MLDSSRFGEFAEGDTSPVMPTARDSGNYRPPVAPSPTGGGVLGGKEFDMGPQTQPTSGAGDDSGTSPSSGGTSGSGADGASAWAFDEGGDVPGQVPDDNDATIDPMQIIGNVLAHGRQKMGLPAKFYADPDGEQNGSVQQQSFEDGGVIPDGQQQDEGSQEQAAPVDPQAAIKYLAAAGAMDPAEAEALEQSVDPQGAMSPGQRKLNSIKAAGSPDNQFAALQHYRGRYLGQAAAAKAALTGSPQRPGDPARAAIAATQAFANIPTGHDISFAPAQGGIAISVKPHAVPQPSFEEGGNVSGNTGLEGEEESGNIEDRRNEPFDPAKQKAHNRQRNISSVTGALNEGVSDFAGQLGFNAGKHRKAKEGSLEDQAGFNDLKFEEGGEVPDDEEGVIPTEDSATEPDPETTGGIQETLGDAIGMRGRRAQEDLQTQGAQGWSKLLTPQQFSAMVDAGYDKPAEAASQKGGLVSWLQSLMGGSQEQPAQAQLPAQSPALRPGSMLGNLFGQKDPNMPDDVGAAVEAEETAPPGPGAGNASPAPQGPQQPQNEVNPINPATYKSNIPGDPLGRKPAPPPPDADEEKMLRLERTAARLFPTISQQELRQNWIADRLKAEEAQKGHEKIEGIKAEGGLNKINATWDRKDALAHASQGAKMNLEQQKMAFRQMNSQDQEQMKNLRTLILSNQQYQDNPALALKVLEPVAARFRMTPADVAGMLQSMAPSGQGAGAAPQGGAQKPIGNTAQTQYKPGVDYPMVTKSGKTVIYRLDPDGMMRPKSGP